MAMARSDLPKNAKVTTSLQCHWMLKDSKCHRTFKHVFYVLVCTYILHYDQNDKKLELII